MLLPQNFEMLWNVFSSLFIETWYWNRWKYFFLLDCFENVREQLLFQCRVKYYEVLLSNCIEKAESERSNVNIELVHSKHHSFMFWYISKLIKLLMQLTIGQLGIFVLLHKINVPSISRNSTLFFSFVYTLSTSLQ